MSITLPLLTNNSSQNSVEEFWDFPQNPSNSPVDIFLATPLDENRKKICDKFKQQSLVICNHSQLYLPSKDDLDYTNSPIKIQEENEQFFYPIFDEKNGYLEKTREIKSVNQKDHDGLLSYYSTPSSSLDPKFEKLKMLVCVTMYSEGHAFLQNTLRCLQKNLDQLSHHAGLHNSQIAVVVIQDGIMKMKQDMIDMYSNEIDSKSQQKPHLQNRIHIIQEQIDFMTQYSKQESALQANFGFPNTIPSKTCLLYQNLISFDDQGKFNSFNNNSSGSQQQYTQGQDRQLVTFSAFKHLNEKKLSSHLWFFEGFCPQFKPKYCVLVDVGTLPSDDGLLKFYMAMEGDAYIGGVCGFLGLEEKEVESETIQRKESIIKDRWRTQLLNQIYQGNSYKTYPDKIKQEEGDLSNFLESIKENEEKKENLNDTSKLERKKYVELIYKLIFSPLLLVYYLIVVFLLKIVLWYFILGIIWILKNLCLGFFNLACIKKAQIYEYTISHMIDKNFESHLGFLHVLPGAWSAYRYQALQVKLEGSRTVMQKNYLKPILNPEKMNGTIGEANMFLAEDRILCLSIYCQTQSKYKLKYIPDAYAKTDAVSSLKEFMGQRRRWINSSFFALDNVLKHYHTCCSESDHSFYEKEILLPFNMLFAKMGQFNSYFLPAFYLFVAIVCSYQFENFSYTGLSSIGFAFMNLIPAIFAITNLFVIFASLVLKVKMDSKGLLEQIQDWSEDYLVNKENKKKQEYDSKQIYENLKNNPTQNSNKQIQEAFDKYRKIYLKNRKEQGEQAINKFSSKKIAQGGHEEKLSQAVDTYLREEFGAKTFSVLSAIMSVISLIIVVIVLFSIVVNVLFEQNSFDFKNYSDHNIRSPILILVCMNLFSFTLILIVHIIPQPMRVWDIIRCGFSFLVYQPVYNHVLLTYAFCNVDDVTWGTKGIIKEGENKTNQYMEKVKFVGNWLFLNALLVAILVTLNVFFQDTPYVTLTIGAYATVYLFIKSILGSISYLKYFLYEKRKYAKAVEQTKQDKQTSQQIQDEFIKSQI